LAPAFRSAVPRGKELLLGTAVTELLPLPLARLAQMGGGGHDRLLCLDHALVLAVLLLVLVPLSRMLRWADLAGLVARRKLKVADLGARSRNACLEMRTAQTHHMPDNE